MLLGNGLAIVATKKAQMKQYYNFAALQVQISHEKSKYWFKLLCKLLKIYFWGINIDCFHFRIWHFRENNLKCFKTGNRPMGYINIIYHNIPITHIHCRYSKDSELIFNKITLYALRNSNWHFKTFSMLKHKL